MKFLQPDASFGFKARTLIVICIAWPGLGVCIEPASPEMVAAPSSCFSPFAVGGSVRKPLPLLECGRCIGPVPYVPCDAHDRGYLYYGTNPFEDDRLNRWDDCSFGQCGQWAISLSRAWINLNGHFNRAASGFHGEGCGCGVLCTNECRP